MDAKDESYSYVTYGMLHKNHEFVDWVRVDLEEDDKVRVQNASSSASADADSFKDMDERAFEKLKTQWQEISASEAALGRSASNDSLAKVQDSINRGKQLLASASAKSLTPDSISYGVFDADWNPVKFTPRHSNVDVAILLHAASKEGKETADTTKMRTYLTENLDNGNLPIVPVKRSAQQQFLIKQSVQLFFRKDSIQFFACFPLRYSPRTIYRFDMIRGGIDHTFWQKVKIQNGSRSSLDKPSMNDKLTEMRVKMAGSTAEFRENFQKGTDEIKNSFTLSMAKTQESILNLTQKKQQNPLLLTNNDDTAHEAETALATTKVPAKQKLTEMRLKMTTNAFNMKNTLASKMSTTKGSLLKMNKHQSDEATDATAVEATAAAAEPKEAEKPNVTARLSTMKLRMSGNMKKFGFGSKAASSPTKKESFWSMRKKKTSDVADTDAPTEAKKPMPTTLTEMKERMTENTNQMKQRMTENTNQMKQRMTENTNQMKTSFASTVSATKQSFLNITTKKSTDSAAAAAPAKESESDIDSLLSEEFTFTIDGEDDDDHATPISTPSGASSPAGYVALTLDDVPCRFDDRSHSQLENVLDLLKKYNAKATFMVISSFLADCHEPDMIRLLVEGHELGNHGVKDEAMDKMATSVDTFVEAIDECNTKITELQKKANTEVGVKWFRAPQAKYTKIMEEGLVQRDMHNVMCDAYAACPIVEDGPWIASVLSKQIRNGSIALLHMPEKRGFREHCLEALEQLLEDLQKRNFKVVTVGELDRIAKEVAASKEEESKEQEMVFSSV